MKNIIDWFVKSSADPTRLSLTVKGILIGVIPVVLMVAPILGLNLEEGSLKDLVNAIDQAFIALFGLAAAITTLYGLSRKIATGLRK